MNITTSKYWRRYVDLTGVVVCIVAVAIFWFAGIRPLRRRHTSRHQYQVALQARKLEASQGMLKLATVIASLEEAKNTFAASPVQLRSAADTNKRIARMAKLTRDCGLKLNKIRPGTATADLRYETVPISLVGTGNYRTCVALLEKLRETFRDMTVHSLELTGDPSDPNRVASFRIDLLWHAVSGPHAMAH